MFSFEVTQTDGKARLGRMATAHGEVITPVFMPIGTAGTVKGVTPDQLRAAGVEMVLANTYHLMLRPGADTAARLGGIHRIMGWPGAILTDSGGYQVFSLAHLRKISDDGVLFKSHLDGAEVMLTPERAVEIQQKLGADIIMQLDECPHGLAPKDHVAAAVRRSADWAARCKDAWQRAGRKSAGGDEQALFGIQQGGVWGDLRAESAQRLVELDLPGYAVGGLSVGEGHDAMLALLDEIDSQLPRDRPRYLMGVGEPRDLLAAVMCGADMFDCVLPTRNGRNAQAFTSDGRIRLRNARWADDPAPLEEECDCYTCRNFSRGTLRHLFMADEMLGPVLVTIHNIRFFARLMEAVRSAIAAGNLETRSRQLLERMYAQRNDRDG
ncbi:MAG TPA: tRNA guanosine(34) transglycosylase Tgt [Phycisphaerae bacterium]|nr:tRNA guanosine(34) transglycosylase Tgt [Phycisphaerae bacterium]